MPDHRRSTLLAALALTIALAAPGAGAQRGSAHAARAAGRAHPLTKAGWVHDVTVTEYYPVPEKWFVGRKVATPGLTVRHRIDWLYSATGVSMEGEGIGLDGRMYHIDALGSGGWVNERGRPSIPGKQGWKGGPPAWRAGAFWLTHAHRVTFPLEAGGWSNGTGKRYVPLPGVTFAPGPSKPLRYYRSIAVDPRLIPLGSLVYVAAYAATAGHGWFRAQDVGGAIIGRHVDVYRSPPQQADAAGGGLVTGVRIYVIPPGARAGRGAPPRSGSPAPAPSRSGGAGAP